MSIILDDKYWEETMSNPDKDVATKRKVLWSVWFVLTHTPLENRNEHWDHASKEVKRLLLESR